MGRPSPGAAKKAISAISDGIDEAIDAARKLWAAGDDAAKDEYLALRRQRDSMPASPASKALESGSVVDAKLWAADDPSLPDMTYRGGHTAPVDPEYHAPLHDMTKTYPDDIYSGNGARYYGHGDPELDNDSFEVINAVRGQPDIPVNMYRAVPLDAPDEILPGDWVTVSERYARLHGEGLGEYKVLQGETQARKLRTDGNSPHEYGYTGFATPAMLTSTAGASIAGATIAGMDINELTASVSAYHSRRQQKKSQWDQRRADLLDTMAHITSVAGPMAGSILNSMDMPMQGIHGLTAVAGSLAAGNSFQDSMMRGGTVARQPIEDTANDLGGAVVDATGSPMLGTAVYTGVQMGGF